MSCSSRRSVPFSDIVSYKQKTDWYSPGAPNITVRDADIFMLRDLKQMSSNSPVEWEKLSNAWLGKLFAAEHLFCFRIDGLDGPGVWNLALGSFEESAVIAWPGTFVQCGGGAQHQYFEFDQVERLTFRGVFDIEIITAIKMEWRSPAWQTNKKTWWFVSCSAVVLQWSREFFVDSGCQGGFLGFTIGCAATIAATHFGKCISR